MKHIDCKIRKTKKLLKIKLSIRGNNFIKIGWVFTKIIKELKSSLCVNKKKKKQTKTM